MNAELYSVEILRTERCQIPQTEIENMSRHASILFDSSSSITSFCIFINSVDYSFVFFKCFLVRLLGDWNRNCTLSYFEGSFVGRIYTEK